MSALLLRPPALALGRQRHLHAPAPERLAQKHLDLGVDAPEVGRRAALERAPQGRLDAQRVGLLRGLGHAPYSYWYSEPVLTIGCVSRSEQSTTIRFETIAARRSSSSSTTPFSDSSWSAFSTIETAPMTIF